MAVVSYCYPLVTIFNPINDMINIVRKKSLAVVVGSLNINMPNNVVPTAPIPVQTA